MISYIQEIDKVRMTMQALGIVKSERNFSEHCLGKSANYFGSKKATKTNIGIPALTNLYSAIKQIRSSGLFSGVAFNNTYSKELEHCQDIVGEVIRMQLQQRVCSGNILYIG